MRRLSSNNLSGRRPWLAGAQAAAIAETEQHTGLVARGHGQQTPRLILAHHQRDLLRLTDVIDLGSQIQSPQRHAQQELQPSHDAVASANAYTSLAVAQRMQRHSLPDPGRVPSI